MKGKKSCGSCETPKYCSKCGTQLVVRKEIHTEYDVDTGERVDWHWHYWRCPKVNPIAGFLFGHTSFDDVPTYD